MRFCRCSPDDHSARSRCGIGQKTRWPLGAASCSRGQGRHAQCPGKVFRGHCRFSATYRAYHTATLACASTFFAMGVSSRWKNFDHVPTRIGYGLLPRHTSTILSAVGRVSGQSHSMCGKSGGEHQVVNTNVVAHLDRRPLNVLHTQQRCCRVHTRWAFASGMKPSRRLFQLKCLSYQ